MSPLYRTRTLDFWMSILDRKLPEYSTVVLLALLAM